MVYTQKQIRIIQRKRPDLRFQRIPTLDDLIVDFLKKFDVIVKPKNYESKNDFEDTYTNIFRNENDEKIYNYKKENELKEWEQWKKWALEHSDFELFRVNKIQENQIFNKKILDKLNSDEVLEEFKEVFEKSNNSLNKKIFLFCFLLFSFIFLFKFIKLSFTKNNQNISFLYNLNYLEKLQILQN